MTYLVQKTNMFKQKMKIDDKITGSKMHTEQIWDSCTRFPRVGFTLTEFMIHYLHRLVKLFLVNLQSTVSGIIKVLNKSLEGCSLNDRLAFGGAQLNATQTGDGSPRVGLPRTPDIQVAGGPFSFHFSAFGFSVTVCLPFSLTPVFSIQRPHGHFLLEGTLSMIKPRLFHEWQPPHAPECPSGPPAGTRVVDVGCLCDAPCTHVLQVLDVTPGRSGSQININAGGKWAGEGGGCADCGDC